jgi:hypothetical protein
MKGFTFLQPPDRRRGQVSEVTIVTPFTIIRVGRRKPLIANGLQYNHRAQRFMPIIRVRRRKSLGE